jgi:hypothetical protein
MLVCMKKEFPKGVGPPKAAGSWNSPLKKGKNLNTYDVVA